MWDARIGGKTTGVYFGSKGNGKSIRTLGEIFKNGFLRRPEGYILGESYDIMGYVL